MKEKVPVTVTWESCKLNNLPLGKEYITVSRFEEDKNWKLEAWSIVLEFEIPPFEQGNPSIGKAGFLVEDAPFHRLQEGVKFELYEGAKKAAVVTVL